MTIIYQTGIDTAADMYKMRNASGTKKMTECAGKKLLVSKILRYSEADTNGGTRDAVRIMDTNGTIYATSSPSFIRSLDQIIAIFCQEYGEAVTSLDIISATSRAGRQYLTCQPG